MSSKIAARLTPGNGGTKRGRPAGLRAIIAAALQLNARRQEKSVPNA
ncbi:hypothetical protein GGQ64_003973 [Rhizobium azooxidifex]|uniref:Uncharacterized protein n=1 Tax=Mycoplana azooxidifex TaxID=1636188 RepID=A0A7W6GKZ9_9HYPH|nr:hypothetical protein [Mycoplana azooxidifex]MBB3978738.1 hypothetical protein [Mycoplana azooxidifex]